MSRTTQLEDTPWVHLTYLFDDETMDETGRGACVMSCHGCGDVWLLQYSPEHATQADGMLVIRNKFEYLHRECKE